MSLELRDGDYTAATADDSETLTEEVLFRLTARRGSFPFLPELGSRMYWLRREKPSAWESLAEQYAVEALSGLDNVTVTGVRVSRTEDGLAAAVDLLWQGDALTVTAQLEG